MPNRKKTTTIITKSLPSRPAKLAVQNKGKASARGQKQKNKTSANQSLLNKVSPAGLGFLKCTIAPFDFSDTDFTGVPDEFSGRTIAKRHYGITDFPAQPGQDLYIVCAPIPGIAYMWGVRTPGSSGPITLIAVPYPDSAALMPLGSEDTNVSKFRFASNVLEFMNTSNDMSWSGTVLSATGKVALAASPVEIGGIGGVDADSMHLSGLMQLINTAKWECINTIKDGAYTPSYNSESTYEWSPVRNNFTFSALSQNQAIALGVDQNLNIGGSSFNFVGLGEFDTIVYKFPNMAAGQTGLIRTSACVEYQVTPSSILYDYSHSSPAYDPLAISLAKEFHKSIQITVPFRENANFWEKFKTFLRGASKVLAHLPGPVGLIGAATGALLTDGHGLY